MSFDLTKLTEPFSEESIKWRADSKPYQQHDGSYKCRVVAYIDARDVMDRLDEVVGPANWKNEYRDAPNGGVLCGVSLLIDGEWVTKWDGAENTNIEGVKGGLSDAFKRAAVHWGIGRYLYGMEAPYCRCEADGNKVKRLLETPDAQGNVGRSNNQPPAKPQPKQESKKKPPARLWSEDANFVQNMADELGVSASNMIKSIKSREKSGTITSDMNSDFVANILREAKANQGKAQ